MHHVSPAYLAYLQRFDSKAPSKEKRPFLWPVRIGDIDYALPFSTQVDKAGFVGILKCPSVDSALNIRYMIPVPTQAAGSPLPVWEGLREAVTFFNANEAYVRQEAALIHRLAVSGQMSQDFLRHSVDYAKLEIAYVQWQPGQQTGHFLYPNKEGKTMPISKKGNLYYTKEQYQKARYDSSALEYAQSQGYELVRDGDYYHLKGHDSMIFTPRGNWFWNSRGLQGGALEFMMYYEDKTITEAVLTLCGEDTLQQSPTTPRQAPPTAARPPVSSPPNTPKQFVPPLRAESFTRLFAYLCGTRGLEKSVVQDMIRQKVLYQSQHPIAGGDKVAFNACFLSYDPEGRPCGAYLRGLSTYGPAYKREVLGSDKRYGWLFRMDPEAAPQAVAVFEASIDAASYASLCRMTGPSVGRGLDLLSLGGVDPKALDNYLSAHPGVKDVLLCLDNDDAGKTAAASIQKRLTEQGYNVVDSSAGLGNYKDWNEYLVAARQNTENQETLSQEPAGEPELN